MSTKTTFKRVALVAVAALGLGMISVAPSSATVSNQTFTVTNGSATQTVSDSTTAAVINVSGLISVGGAARGATGAGGDTVTVGFIQKSIPATALAASIPKMTLVETTTAASQLIHRAAAGGVAAALTTQTNGGSNTYVLDNSESTTAGIALSEGFAITRATAGYYGAKFILQLDSVTAPTAGTYTYTVVVTTYSVPAAGGAYTVTQSTQDVSIVVAAAAAASKTVNVANSFARLNLTSNVDAAGSDAVITSLSTASATAVGYLEVGVRNASNATGVAEDSVTVTITGAGILKQGTVTGTSFKIAATGDVEFEILPDGRAGVGTINVSTNNTTYAAKTVTFYAKAAKTITATVDFPVLAVGANANAIEASAVDANGTRWSGQAYIVASSAADALVAGSTTPVKCSFDTTDLVHYCPVTAVAAGTAKLKVIDAATVATATATSNEVTVTVSTGTPASVKLAFDKATYAPFEKATITVTPLDAAGKPISKQTDAALLATGGITSTYAFSAGSDTLTASTFSTSALTGAKSYTVYMPAASGDVVISATGGTALAAAGQVKVTATATVVNPSVDAATDAANAATDAALAAADAADAATAAAQDASDAVAALSAEVSKMIASLKAQITSLTNLVIKIQKKVRA